MYSVSSLKKALDQPRLAIGEINRLSNQGLGSKRDPSHNQAGIDIFSEDWDKLIILDACRYDVFQEASTELPGDLRKVESKASSTVPFLRANFSDKDLTDTVYVTANPQLYRIENGVYDSEPMDVSLHSQIDVWQDQWHEEYRTVMPEVVTDAAIKAADRYPDKRLVVHYLQPHAPYIGPIGRENLPSDYLNFWTSFRKGKFDISIETAKKAYRENLEIVLTYVEELLSEFEGRTVVTSDHGELLGERDSPIPIKRYGHLPYRNIPELLEVPWLTVDKEPRPKIRSEPQETRDEGDGAGDEEVKDRLRDLGYMG